MAIRNPGKANIHYVLFKGSDRAGEIEDALHKKALSQAENPFTEIVSVFADFAAR